ncbi:sulfonate transport system ATP-binding protein [Streptomyces sp. V3I8]|jgi:sulfonate transport system ATP-binding protein|uniref:ATP-binding cassette domain-containing protein n=1 Tax=Streptomyces sp. V3I8 TaxID=3042279 RepID=UPI0027877A69|nr:ATP-binding cassette domain-containing protein [Streptomyces sp. V3I8]MDQ1040424.1 sulfonate transport system ATP-binding protein [Streptomyces sp. V3I8]
MATDIQEPAAPASAVRVEGLTRTFGDRAVLKGLGLDVRPGEFVAVLGRSGCGGSTLVRVLAGLDRDVEGTVLVPRRKAAVFQEPRPTSWKRVVRRHALLGLPGGTARTQRAALARALLREPDLLLLDEPFGALDPPNRRRAQRLLGELWRRRGCAVLLVTHDAEEAVLLADRVLVLDRGVIAHETGVELDRPRDSADPRFTALRAKLAGLLARPGDAGPSS